MAWVVNRRGSDLSKEAMAWARAVKSAKRRWLGWFIVGAVTSAGRWSRVVKWGGQ